MSQGRRTETPHHSREQVTGYLDDAHAIVDELGIPDELRGIAYAKAIDLLAAKHIAIEQPYPLAGVPGILPHLT